MDKHGGGGMGGLSDVEQGAGLVADLIGTVVDDGGIVALVAVLPYHQEKQCRQQRLRQDPHPVHAERPRHLLSFFLGP